ncbi:MAG: hypothetical protein JW846_03300 [Dehalococcoidia bacterium]|nr:hypothetical protein [Dehalococcoidia bacterium]
MRGRLGKVGMLMLALVFAVAVMGAGFASWTDQVVVSGTVTTADFGWRIYQLSEVWVYKDLVTDEVVTLGAPLDPIPPEMLLVSYADIVDVDPFDASEGREIEVPPTFEVVYWNLFPCVWHGIDIGLHYIGGIPAHLTVDCEWEGDPLLGETMSIEAYNYDTLEEIDFMSEPFYYQWEFCDRVKLWFWFHLDQLDELMSKSGSFTCTITNTQWNEPAP